MRISVITILFCCLPSVAVLRAQEVADLGSEAEARALLDAAKAKIMSLHGLRADFHIGSFDSTAYFTKGGEMVLERPNKFALYRSEGANVEVNRLYAVSDGLKVTTIGNYRVGDDNFIAYAKPLHAENFFLGQNFLVQFFFDPRPIQFDPSDAAWDQTVSLFKKNLSADRDASLVYMGKRTVQFVTYDVVQIKYYTYADDIRQQIYIGPDKLIYQVDTYSAAPVVTTQRFRNFRIDPELPGDAFKVIKDPKLPLVETDPVRLGAPAPDFTIPDYNGKDLSLKTLLKDKKGLFISVLDGGTTLQRHKPDSYLQHMKVLQELKNQFESQGLMIVCVYGGPRITPDMVGELKINGMPFVSRFNYPIAFDVDIERGIQGSVFENFHLGNRNNILLDKDGTTVFACEDFPNRINQLSLYQALAQIGFTVSAADLDTAARK